jgi:hypothetical protein
LLSLRFPASESLWRTTSSLEASTGAVPVSDRKFASDPYNRRPRSLAAADHRAPDQS